jgi:peptide deformylase
MVREIAKYGASVLRQKAQAVEQIDAEIGALVQDMFDSMAAARGVGLAAPQLGVLKRVIVVDVSEQQPQHLPIALINPRVVQGQGRQVGEEGCLSFPDLYSEVARYDLVVVEALDVLGKAVSLTATGFYSRVLQHEIDHLDGGLFVDHVSPLKRQLMRGVLKRLRKEGEEWDERQAVEPVVRAGY